MEQATPLNSGIPIDGQKFVAELQRLCQDKTFHEELAGIGNRFSLQIAPVSLRRFTQFLIKNQSQRKEGIHYYQQIPPKPLIRMNTKRQVNVFRVHDLFPIQIPKAYGWKARITFRRRLKNIGEADYLMPNSSETMREIEKYCTKNQIVSVVECKIPSFEIPKFDSENEAEYCVKTLGKFVFSVGAIVARKSHLLTIDFWERHLAPLGYSLVIVGSSLEKKFSKRIWTKIKQHSNSNSKLIWLSDLESHHLYQLYYNAQGYLSMSSFEGFNIPIHDAVMMGLPILCHPQAIKNRRIENFAIANDNLFTLNNYDGFIRRMTKGRNVTQEDLEILKQIEESAYRDSVRNLVIEMVTKWRLYYCSN